MNPYQNLLNLSWLATFHRRLYLREGGLSNLCRSTIWAVRFHEACRNVFGDLT